jgi:tape measure domain-containing protein
VDEAARLRIIIEALGLRATRRGLAQLQRDLGQSGQSADRFSRDIARSTSRSVANLGRLGRAASIGGIAGLSVGFGAAARSGIKFNAQMESNELAMRRFVGSTKVTRRYLNDLFQIAKKTPFEFTDLTSAARRMMAFGLSAQQTKKTLASLGDAIAAAGGGREQIEAVTRAFGQVQAKGKVYAEELLQFTEAGIPAFRILKQELGLTGKQMKNIGKSGVDSGVAIRALTQGMNRRFSGAAREQSRTWNGLMSTIKDTWAQTTGAMTQSLFREAEQWVPRVISSLGEIGRIFRRQNISFGDKIKLSAGVLQRNVIDPIRQKLGELHIGDKLSAAFERAAPRVLNAMGTLARKGAGAFVRAFMDASAWAHFLTMAFLAHKLGVFRAFGRRAGRNFSGSFESSAAAGLRRARGGAIGGAAMSLGKSIGVTLAVAAAIEFGARFGPAIASAMNDVGNWVKGAAATIGESFGEVLPHRKARRGPGVSIGRGGANLTTPGGGLGGIPSRWNNPREGASGMAGGGTTNRGGGRNRFKDLRIKRGAANTRIQERADTIDFQLTMGKITAGAAADQLDALAQGVKHNKRLRRDLLMRAHGLHQQVSDDARQEAEDARRDAEQRRHAAQQKRRREAARRASEKRRAIAERRSARTAHQRAVRAAQARERRRAGHGDDYEINVGDIKLPTTYEVRRTAMSRLGQRPSGSARQHGTSRVAGRDHGVNIHTHAQIVVNGVHNPQKVAKIVHDQMDHHIRTAAKAAMRQAGMR